MVTPENSLAASPMDEFSEVHTSNRIPKPGSFPDTRARFGTAALILVTPVLRETLRYTAEGHHLVRPRTASARRNFRRRSGMPLGHRAAHPLEGGAAQDHREFRVLQRTTENRDDPKRQHLLRQPFSAEPQVRGNVIPLAG